MSSPHETFADGTLARIFTQREQEVRKTTDWHHTSCSHENEASRRWLFLDVKQFISLPQLFSLLHSFPFTKSRSLFLCYSLVP